MSETAPERHPTQDEFRRVLGRFASGVGVMTTVAEGLPHGMTASAFTSLSLEPRLVLVCVDHGTLMAERVADSGFFAVTFLAADQRQLSGWFADPERPADARQFAGVPTRVAATGAPIIEGGVAWIDAHVHAIHDGGDHHIVVGRVAALGEGASTDPLLYYRSAYHTLASEG